MTTATYINRFLEPVVDAFTPEIAQKIVDLKIDPQLQARVSELAEKANEGELTPEEDAEYKSIIQAADVVGIIQAKARSFLTQR